MLTRLVVVFAALSLIGACANRPETIRASHVSHEKYMHDDCTSLIARKADARAELTKVSAMQDSKATGDAVGVFLILVPFSKLTGDHEGDVARWKGELEAIETAQIIKKCMGSAPSYTAPAVYTAPNASPTPQVVPIQASQPQTATVIRIGQSAFDVERLARDEQCATAPVASMTAKGPGFENYTVPCSNGDALTVRCDFGKCRALK